MSNYVNFYTIIDKFFESLYAVSEIQKQPCGRMCIMKRLCSKLSLFSLIIVILLVSSGFSSQLTSEKKNQPKGKKPYKVAALFPGKARDGGFMEAGLNGLLKARDQLGVEISYVEQIKPETGAITEALRELAEGKPDLIVSHGGQANAAAQTVAKEFPNIKFVVTQGSVTGKNLSSYQVLQEESAWLAGAAAGMLTKTNIVGHISGVRVTPGLLGRAAFADGLKYTNPTATFLTTFNGNQDDPAVARKAAEAEIAAGADIIFTMLNAGRIGAIEACRENGVFQIGNVRDWYADAPDVFIASAIADSSQTVYSAISDLVGKDWEGGVIKKIGIDNPDAVRLALAPTVPQEVADKIAELSKKLASGEIKINLTYDGPEFEVK
ncbi:BMP family ABC transporter substrate-binding protein [Paenibacillus mesophilus]|nr:BMP family ABC transporter substrate-binding protein [Paenibacillus mesophilus]